MILLLFFVEILQKLLSWENNLNVMEDAWKVEMCVVDDSSTGACEQREMSEGEKRR